MAGPSKGGARVTRPKRLTTEAAKDKLVTLISQGSQIGDALDNIGYARKTYEYWRKNDPGFKTRVDQARQLRDPKRETERRERLGFAEWRLKYLGVSTPLHQLQWVDMLEGRTPRDLHESQVYQKGTSGRQILINCPPFHGKSIAITVDYSTYRLCMDPSYRIVLVSASQALAKDFLYGIKDRLTSPDFLELQKAYAPDGGWETDADSWTESRIVFSAEWRNTGTREMHEKDANVQALGIGSQVYGRRADLIILDDAVDGTNVSQYAKQIGWLRREVESRVEMGGKILIVGTRIASVDLYSELMKPENYANQTVPWNHLASPAILEESADPKKHVTLWPLADVPWVNAAQAEMGDECTCGDTLNCSAGVEIDGRRQYPRWDGIHLERGPRASNNNRDWALIYQQQSVAEDATFPQHAVTAATNGARQSGLLKESTVGHPYQGMLGMYVVAGLDPAIKGFAGIVVYAIDRESRKRYVLNAWNLKAPTKKQLEDKMKEVTVDFKVDEWRVERTGLLQFFTQDAELRSWFASRGVRFTEHLTGASKNDPTYGVSSLGPLFGEYTRAYDDPNGAWSAITEPLIELPRAQNSDGLKALVHQLITWTPELDPNKVPCDMVMALWFAECGAREHLGYGSSGNVRALARSNRFVSPRRQQGSTFRLADFRAQRP